MRAHMSVDAGCVVAQCVVRYTGLLVLLLGALAAPGTCALYESVAAAMGAPGTLGEAVAMTLDAFLALEEDDEQ